MTIFTFLQNVSAGAGERGFASGTNETGAGFKYKFRRRGVRVPSTRYLIKSSKLICPLQFPPIVVGSQPTPIYSSTFAQP